MLSSSLVLAALLTISPGDDKTAPALEGDRARLQGAWTGSAKGGSVKADIHMEIKGDKVILTANPEGSPDQKRKSTGTYKIDEKASPKTWDFVDGKMDDGQAIRDNLAIYKLEGDTLTLGMSRVPGERSTEFKDPSAGPGTLVLTRIKKSAEKPKPGL
jgi:uncharacterized protein (TIGR03067 family)